MSRLSLAFLGAPEIRHADRLVSFPTRKALALLAYLAVEGGTHSREKLTALFWPESSSAQGRATLRSTLAYLREALGEPQAHLIATRDSLAFDTESPFELDTQALQAAARASRELALAAAPARPPAQLRSLLAQLKAAAALCRGEFLEGFSLSDAPEFDDWAGLQRELLHRRATQVFERLAQAQFDSGDLAGAIDTAMRWVARDRLSEAAYRRLMQLHLAAGDRVAALQAYEACRGVLERELNAEPSPETDALAARVRRAAPDIEIHRQRDQEPLVALAGSFAPDLLVAQLPLVGRADEHMALVAAYRVARQGQAQAVLVQGEPGIGKTRLAREFAAWAAAHGADVLQGRAIESGGYLPYYPLVEALRERLAAEEHPRELLSATWLAELSRLLPELADQVPDLPAPLALAEGEARGRLFEAFARVGQALTRRAPLLCVLDDVQWADEATLELLSYVGRRWAATGTRALVLLTARSDELDRAVSLGGTLADWLAGFGRELPLTTLAPGPLSPEGTAELVASLGLPDLGDASVAFVQWLYQETQGQPFFIIQTLRALAERDLIRRDADGAWSVAPELLGKDGAPGAQIPQGVRELIGARLARVSRPAMQLCVAAAVLGDGSAFEALRDAGGLAEMDALAAIEELVRRGLLREQGQRYRFAHDKIREVAYTQASAAHRRILHRRALGALEHEGAPPATLAWHAHAAGLAGPAFRYSLAAGDAALRVFAARMALAHYQRAHELAADAGAAGADLERLYLQSGRAAELIQAWERARDAYQELLALARAVGRIESACLALNRLATVSAQGFFDLASAVSLLQEAQALAERSGEPAHLAETVWNLAQITFYRWEVEASLAHGERALALARAIGDQELIGRSLNIIAYDLLMLGRMREVASPVEEARAIFASLGQRAMEVDCLSIVAILRVHEGELAASIAAAREGIAISRAIETPWGEANCAYSLAQALIDSGALEEALAVAQAGVAAARQAGHPPTLVFNLLALGQVHRALFAFSQAREIHAEADAIARSLGHPLLIEWAAIEGCADCALAGDWEGAAAAARQALAHRNYQRVYVGFSRWHEIESLLRAGDLAAAHEDVRRMSERPPEHRREQLQRLRIQAALARWSGDHSQAAALLEEAAELALALGLLSDRWQIDLALGDLYRACGDEERAQAAFARTRARGDLP